MTTYAKKTVTYYVKGGELVIELRKKGNPANRPRVCQVCGKKFIGTWNQLVCDPRGQEGRLIAERRERQRRARGDRHHGRLLKWTEAVMKDLERNDNNEGKKENK